MLWDKLTNYLESIQKSAKILFEYCYKNQDDDIIPQNF
ncbi:Uncharacterised protein [Moraxella lacunata]|uniref:Uncharacterized protein n=1 Tax=Moraxella lacunata TaxID=477 RepID=A0A378T4B3_MORLA|nr:Uncharacterised protein [Moraxella lacunata]